jgi:hypothetical protein
MRRKEAGSSRTSMLRRARCAGHGVWRLDYRSSRSRVQTTKLANKQAALAPAHSATVANGSFRILATMRHEWRALPGPWCSTSPAKCQHRVPPGRKWGAPDRRQGQAGALPCRAPYLPGPSSAKAGPGSAGPGRCLGREVPAGRPVPSCDLDGQVQPAATLLRRWRWISDHRHTIILLPSPYSDKVLRSLSLTAGSSAG